MTHEEARRPAPLDEASDGSSVSRDIDTELSEAEADVGAAAATLTHDVEALVAERDDLREMSQRIQADFENYRKRMLREQTAMVERATEGLVEQLLPVLDSFEAALGQLAGDDVDAESVRKGVALVADQLRGVLAKAGLETLATSGVAFDPHEHEAVLQEPGDGAPSVGEVMRAGYRLKGRVLRPAMVKVVHTDPVSDGDAPSDAGDGP